MNNYMILLASIMIAGFIWSWRLDKVKSHAQLIRKIVDESERTPVNFYTVDDVLDHPDLQKILDAKTAQLTGRNS